MSRRTLSRLWSRRAPLSKSPTTRHRVLRSELLEPRALLAGNTLSALLIRPPLGSSALVAAGAARNAAPTVSQAINANSNAAITGKTASLSVLGRDDGGESNLVYRWSVTSAPAGATTTFSLNGSNAAKKTTLTFSKAGTYAVTVRMVDRGGLAVSVGKSITVTQTLAGINFSTASGQVANPGASLAVSGASQTFAAVGVDQFGNALATQPAFIWSVATVPNGVTKPTLAASGARATVTFVASGSYAIAVQAKLGRVSVTRNVPLTVTMPTVTSIRISTASGQMVNSGSTLQIGGVSQAFAVQGVDQFGKVLATPPNLVWSVTSLPAGASAPSFATKNAVTTVTFGMAGYYSLTARVSTVTSVYSTMTVIVDQTLTSIALSPDTPYVLQRATQQFTAKALDQFRQSMANQQTFAWSTNGGTISTTGLFTAPSSGTTCTVTVKSGTLASSAKVAILANAGKLQNAALASLVSRLYADGSISRLDMIQILRSVGADGTVDATEFTDLKELLYLAKTLNIPEYVQTLAGDVINGSFANATFQGKALGNLAINSSATQLNTLIGKWFLGTDHPTLCNTSLVYRSTSGSLFSHTPSHTDEYQGQLGDCYFISALGTLADSNPAAVQNMFIDNGDGTFTVRFYSGTYGTIYNSSDGSISAGFKDNIGTVDYVTVDRMLPTDSTGMLVYANYGANYSNTANTLWIALAEKAYAQWNETGKEGRDGKNAYASIQGGWMATVDAQVLGYNAINYIMTRTDKQVAIDALAAHKAVTIGTLSWSGTVNGLYANHAYAIVGYDASTDTFTLYNPWGSDQPGPLTWSQLQANCSQLAVADTSGSVPISTVSKAGTAKVSSPACVSGAVATATFYQAGPASTPSLPSRLSARGASPAWFAALGSSAILPSYQYDLAGRTGKDLAAPLVDATFAGDCLLWSCQV